jgi:hypothetical protein
MTFFALVLNRPMVLICSRSAPRRNRPSAAAFDLGEQARVGLLTRRRSPAPTARPRRAACRGSHIRARSRRRDWPRPAGGRIRKPRASSQRADHVAHRIEAGRLADEEARGGERAAAKIAGFRRGATGSAARRGRGTSRHGRRRRCRRGAPRSRSRRLALEPGAVAAALLSALPPRPRAAASPSASAVPDGASAFIRWCVSTISMSHCSGPSTRAARSTRSASRRRRARCWPRAARRLLRPPRRCGARRNRRARWCRSGSGRRRDRAVEARLKRAGRREIDQHVAMIGIDREARILGAAAAIAGPCGPWARTG